jgi:transcriptional regulator GlxA family with amidase domain
VDLAGLWGSPADALGERLRGRTFEERVDVIEQVLAARVPARAPADSELQAVIERIGADPGGTRVAPLAANTGLSRQRFTCWFTDAVGMGPKRFARIRRAQRLLRHVTDGSDEDWSQVALRLGYYDQAHMIGDFHWLTGDSPARFRAAHRAARRA